MLTRTPTDEEITQVYNYHCVVMSNDPPWPRGWKLTEGLAKKIRKRLETFTASELNSAAHNLSKSPWHRGDNPQRKEYCDPLFLYRNDEQVDKWLNARTDTEEYREQWTPS